MRGHTISTRVESLLALLLDSREARTWADLKTKAISRAGLVSGTIMISGLLLVSSIIIRATARIEETTFIVVIEASKVAPIRGATTTAV